MSHMCPHVSRWGPAGLQCHPAGCGGLTPSVVPWASASPLPSTISRAAPERGMPWASPCHPPRPLCPRREQRCHRPRVPGTPCGNHTSGVPTHSAAEKPKLWAPRAGEADSEVPLSPLTAQMIYSKRYIRCKETFLSAGLPRWRRGLITHRAGDKGVTAPQDGRFAVVCSLCLHRQSPRAWSQCRWCQLSPCVLCHAMSPAPGFNENGAMGVWRWKGKKGDLGKDVGGYVRGAQWGRSHLWCCHLCLLTHQPSPAWPCLHTLPACLPTLPLQRQPRSLTASSQRHLVAEKEIRWWKPNRQPSPPGYLQAVARPWWCLLCTWPAGKWKVLVLRAIGLSAAH